MSRTSPILYLGVRGTVVALDRVSGHEYWRTPLKGWDFVNLTLEGDSLFAATRGEVFCLDPMTGQIRWNNPLRGLGYGLICIAGTNPTGAIAQYRANAEAAASSGAVSRRCNVRYPIPA
ncbi:MAG TPA: PQQ-binding-like beta-propeller repeat protein [Tepidisphaeraceae bacterium]|jgi:outer membrane protein assembly factor BamB